MAPPNQSDSVPANDAPVGLPEYCLPTGRLVDLHRWRVWISSGLGSKQLERWAARHPALIGWGPQRRLVLVGGRPVLELEAPQTSPRTDAMQAALVELAQAGDAGAAVTILVQLRPGLGRLVRQVDWRQQWSHQETVEEVRAVFFEVLAGHRLDRRPARIAANLLLDTRQRLGRSSRPVGTGSWPPTRCDDGGLGQILLVETIRSVIETLPGSAASRRLTSDLAYRAWILEQPGPLIARELGIGHQRVRSRLHRLRRAIDRDGSLQRSA